MLFISELQVQTHGFPPTNKRNQTSFRGGGQSINIFGPLRILHDLSLENIFSMCIFSSPFFAPNFRKTPSSQRQPREIFCFFLFTQKYFHVVALHHERDIVRHFRQPVPVNLYTVHNHNDVTHFHLFLTFFWRYSTEPNFFE